MINRSEAQVSQHKAAVKHLEGQIGKNEQLVAMAEGFRKQNQELESKNQQLVKERA